MCECAHASQLASFQLPSGHLLWVSTVVPSECPVKPGQAGADSTSVSVTFLLAMVKFLATEI